MNLLENGLLYLVDPARSRSHATPGAGFHVVGTVIIFCVRPVFLFPSVPDPHCTAARTPEEASEDGHRLKRARVSWIVTVSLKTCLANIKGFPVDDRLVKSGKLLIVVSDDTDVHVIMKHKIDRWFRQLSIARFHTGGVHFREDIIDGFSARVFLKTGFDDMSLIRINDEIVVNKPISDRYFNASVPLSLFCASLFTHAHGTFERDSDGKRVRARIRSLLEFELREDKTINAIYNLILSDEKLTITDKQINRRPKHWIHFLNGYYDYQAGKFEEHDPKYHEIGVIPWEYAPSRYPENYRFVKRGSGLLRETIEEPLLFNQWLDVAIPEPEDQEMLLQYIGYSMTLETGAQKFLMICGSGGTGKSTLLSVIEAILGRYNISSVSLQGLQERFTPGELYLKQANVCADIPLTALSEVDMVKKLTGEDLISADRKFKSNFLFRSYARLYFSANDIPINLSDKSNAFYRRMLILKMDHIPERVDPDLSEKLKTEIPNIITRAVEALSWSGGVIVESERSKELVKEAHKNSDTVEAFLDDRCELDDKGKINRVDLYAAYFNYCVNEGRTSVTKSNFYKLLDNKGFPSRRNKNNYDIVGLRLSNILPIPTKSAAATS